MSALHATRSAEKLALGWHVLGIAVSLFSALFSAAVAAMVEPLAEVPNYLGGYFLLVYLTVVVNVFLSAAGVVWHLWAAREHRNHLKELHD